jgi:hypothetical protein
MGWVVVYVDSNTPCAPCRAEGQASEGLQALSVGGTDHSGDHDGELGLEVSLPPLPLLLRPSQIPAADAAAAAFPAATEAVRASRVIHLPLPHPLLLRFNSLAFASLSQSFSHFRLIYMLAAQRQKRPAHPAAHSPTT